MKTMAIYEPAMCCETGICGIGVDPELLRISAVVNALQKKGTDVKRFNLSSAPMAFIQNAVVNAYVQEKGAEGLPIAVLDDTIVVEGRYPTNAEFAEWLGVPETDLSAAEPIEKVAQPSEAPSCCCSDGKCC